MRIQWLIGALIVLFHCPSYGKVYRYVTVGDYASSFHLADHKGQSLLSLMKTSIYPAIVEEAIPRYSGSHFNGVKKGVGVELRLTDNVTTFHVKYEPHWVEEAERAGRSFAGVDYKPWNKKTEYLADASYKHYLTSLEKLLKKPSEVEPFYRAILQVLLNCDPSGIENLSLAGQKVAADFVAVFVAEQYRHLISGEGKKLGRWHNWDNAHLQVTLLAAFHAGQKEKAMFYKGRFLSQVYHQKSQDNCVYQKPWGEISENHWYRSMNLSDYWQFNETCERSGVNLTRRDFHRMGRAITRHLIRNDDELNIIQFNKLYYRKWTRSYIESIANAIINNYAPDTYEHWQAQVDTAVAWVLRSYKMADEITTELKPLSGKDL